jgi:DDE superfamily endonuclease
VRGLLADPPRKNCWTLAEHAGDPTPDGMQHLLARAVWDEAAVRDDIRGWVVEHLGDPGATLVIDETGDLKKGTYTVGTQRADLEARQLGYVLAVARDHRAGFGGVSHRVDALLARVPARAWQGVSAGRAPSASVTTTGRLCAWTYGCQLFGRLRRPARTHGSRSRRRIVRVVRTTGGSAGPSGGICPKARCGRWPLS